MRQAFVAFVKVVAPSPRSTSDLDLLARAVALIIGGAAFLIAVLLMGTVLWTAITG